MLMRFIGGGIGHIATRAIVKIADTLRHFFKTAPLAAPVANECDADAVVVPTASEDLLQELDEDEGENDEGEEGEEPEGEEEDEEDEDEDRRSSGD